MAITFNKSRNDDDALMAEINTTPLVDVMLVLLIIFLITIPAVTTSIQVKLPKETNQIEKRRLKTSSFLSTKLAMRIGLIAS